MPTCTDAERKLLDEALKSDASAINVSDVQIAVLLERHPEALDLLV